LPLNFKVSFKHTVSQKGFGPEDLQALKLIPAATAITRIIRKRMSKNLCSNKNNHWSALH
jgi:hypothetical protein